MSAFNIPSRCMALIAALAVVLTFGGVAHATPAPTYVYTYSAGPAAFVGSTATVPIYLNEVPSIGTSSNINDDGGLFSFGFALSITSSTSTITGLSLSRNALFDTQASYTATTSGASLFAEQFDTSLAAPTIAAGQLQVATLTLQGVTGTTIFSLSDFGAGNQTVDFASVAHDPSTSTPNTIVAAPEPTAAMLGLSSLGLLLRRRRVA